MNLKTLSGVVVIMGIFCVLFLVGRTSSVSVGSASERFYLNPSEKTLDYELTAQQNGSVFSFNGLVPGPLIHADVGDTVSVNFHNDLDDPVTVHWHGLIVPNEQDGVPGITQEPVMPGESRKYVLPMKHPGTYWYHSHVRTHEQIERGLYGPIIVDYPNDFKVDQDVVVMLDDVLIKNGKIGPFAEDRVIGAMHGRFGNFFWINGKDSIQLFAKENELVRLRLINPASARVFRFAVEDHLLMVLGRDQGLSERPVMQSYVQLSPGQRADVLIKVKGDKDFYNILNFQRESDIIGKINVSGSKKNTGYYDEVLKSRQPEIDKSIFKDAERINFSLYASEGHWTINGKFYPEDPLVLDLSSQKPYIFTLNNPTMQPHPMHLHGERFVIISRNGIEPDVDSWMDVVYVHGGETVEIGVLPDNPGKWIFHCHIPEHTDMGMISVINVV